MKPTTAIVLILFFVMIIYIRAIVNEAEGYRKEKSLLLIEKDSLFQKLNGITFRYNDSIKKHCICN